MTEAGVTDARLVTDVDGRVVECAAPSPVSDRCAYAAVAEASVRRSDRVGVD